jgi:hypothetical protein
MQPLSQLRVIYSKGYNDDAISTRYINDRRDVVCSHYPDDRRKRRKAAKRTKVRF